MCDDHSGVLVEIPGASERGHLGRKRGIDACIAPLVEALNKAGLPTVASCCGHGRRPGSVILEDGREVLIARSFAEGRLVDSVLDSAYGGIVHMEGEDGKCSACHLLWPCIGWFEVIRTAEEEGTN